MSKKTTAPSEQIAYCMVPSPVGELLITATSEGLRTIYWEKEWQSWKAVPAEWSKNPKHPHLSLAKRELTEYFAGKRRDFTVALDVTGTVFQKRVWRELAKIPFGATISYGEQAKRIGDKKKARAVGGANGRNPISIIVPCHRVIGSNGSLTGFGGGMTHKKFLLEHERRMLSDR